MRNTWLRLIPVAVLMCGTAFFLHGRSRGENLPPHQDLASFPHTVDGWTGTGVKISADTRSILGEGDFLERVYQRSDTAAALDLFIAYFPSQRSGSTFHSPKHCLPGSGWTPISSGEARLAPAGRSAVSVNRYLIGSGSERQLVLYWYQSHGRVETSDYLARLYLVADSLRWNRTDGSIIRITAPAGDLPAQLELADRTAVEFGNAILPLLDRFAPR